METVRSADGTMIAYERFGDGPPVVVVGGATCDRAKLRPTAVELGGGFGAINYDRRGRGDSGDTPPYAIEREVDDIAALIEAAGGSAALYGHSSGAALVLHAAAAGAPVTRIVLHEPPYAVDTADQRREAREYADRLDALLAQDRRGDAVALFMSVVGMPAELIEASRGEPWWAQVEELAPTLAYDSAVVEHRGRGGTVPFDLAGKVSVPALVVSGGASPPWMIETNRQLAEAMPGGRQIVLEGQDHTPPPEILVPAIAGFLTG